MSAALVARRLKELALELLFPPVCGGCQRQGVYFCSDCLGRLAPLQGVRCPRCDGESALLPARTHSRGCAYCAHAFPALSGLRLFGWHETPLREAIHALKYNDFPAIAQPLGERLAESWAARGVPVDGVMAVPLHAERVLQRGYNQSYLLAQTVCETLTLPLMNDILTRVRATRPQVGLRPQERLQNVADAFEATANAAGGTWLLVDDVCTTGATLDGCAAALRKAGAAAVWALVLARPRRQAPPTP